MGKNIYFLSSEDQKSIESDFIKDLPWRSFGRKNIGFLYAIARGAKVIWDFDDDNFLKFWIKGAAVDPLLDIDTFSNVFADDCKYYSCFSYSKLFLKSIDSRNHISCIQISKFQLKFIEPNCFDKVEERFHFEILFHSPNCILVHFFIIDRSTNSSF